MMRKVMSFFIYALFGVSALVLFPLMALTALVCCWDRTRRYPGRLIRRYGRMLTRFVPTWRFTVEGEAPADIDRKGYVVIANHESTGDIFLLTALSWDMRWVAKVELMRLPLIGQILWMCGDIPLRRGDRQSVLRMLEACRDTLRRGMPVMIFPEGTRAKDGTLRPFKDGAFQLAIETGASVLPLALSGSRQCWGHSEFSFGRAHARIRILEPIPTGGMTMDDLPALRDEARRRVEVALKELRGEGVSAMPEGESALAGVVGTAVPVASEALEDKNSGTGTL
ncbi:MAG: 1-acyl-sn-glycerol-3-phosphate acyltransferase [Myxococcaceae bacterium]|nr:1-acyl-sn-glycerol-3-phosphate acyltransferase [Myxococcaceae bacterium]